ncbi:N-acetylmuramoyl-L-alanine amidase [Neobacillus drentensis]|uniref:N-acetylmuramoyl-L-alanine amidase n=1 Tax=Neobacillus drentensis TaxID=220684 RepID=UPI002854E177|nr:N-acetylmuramoyl-L-alanine amidase [Neobacillus drentensis]MDR7240682.1 N-acetylmuramoyl-L-alanine amidase [Neobacillus drentensis]
MKKRLVAFAFTLFLSLVLSFQVSAEASTVRLGGDDRFDVAINVSKTGWSTASTVVLANWDAYGDALTATPLAYKHNAPILLTRSSSLNSRTKMEIQRLNAKSVIIVGGPISVSENIVKELSDMGISVRRISGQNRVDVANNIAKDIGKSSKVVIADGFNFPDALSIAPFAARNGYPILLTNKQHLIEGSTQNLVKNWNVSQTIISGGPLSVSQTVYNTVPNPRRFGGNSRFEVSANIANAYFPSSSNAFISKGSIFADALTGSVLAAKKNAPILLIEPTNLTAPIEASIINNKISQFFILGGPISVSESIMGILSNSIVGKTIVIDPGHGGKDPGASGNGLVEKEIVLDIANRVNSRLSHSLAKVVMTRENDTYPSLEERVNLAEESGADTFVSIHVNTFISSNANGTETWYSSKYAGVESKELAKEIQQELVKALGTYDRGIKEEAFYVIENTKMPSVLVEIGFISNTSDADKLASNTYRQKAADAIYKGIIDFYN